MSYNPEDFHTKEQLENAKKLGEKARQQTGIMSLMSEAELTEAQRECKEPIGTKGLFRMYRWECNICGTNGRKRPCSVAIAEGYEHVSTNKHKANPLNPPVIIRGGVFKKEDLNKY